MRSFLPLLLLLPVLAGSLFVSFGTDWAPADAWVVREDNQDSAGARRAAGDAQAQASLLASGAKQLKEGTAALQEGAQPLGQGVQELAQGSAQLADGLVELQAGTGRLGEGATRVADGVGQAVDQIIGVNAVRGQIIEAIDSTLGDLRGKQSPEANQLRGRLQELKAQAETFELDQQLAGQLVELKNGSRDIANQLHVPGYAYHDGIYQATKGAQELRAGLQELEAGVAEAQKGVAELDGGAGRISQMAQDNSRNVGNIQRVLPTAAPGEPVFDPAVTVLLSGLLLLGGAVLARLGRWTGLAGVIGLGAAGAGVGYLLTDIINPLSVAACVAGAGAGWAAVRVLAAGWGRKAAVISSGVLGVAQTGLSAWLWSEAAAGEVVHRAVMAVANLFPMNWTVSAITTSGNGGHAPLIWVSLGVLAAILLAGLCAPAAREKQPSLAIEP
ncbi:hypothetical protein G7Y31_00905 [Corynebacterium lizhenjunii]|uniref:X-X-X-Leu-X-X-Gly heptad repeat-containing protein n=1 Tax=Corynebacterium lizhenjunii TaxID=2709394 RepID=A0A7T0KF07_9CORY|nr:hypothetical protein [Corynebacterium lizhenjunii]QPK79319.1 hypothetical protein G7Y31_00905 [Corynebacterium lizhenjunii]